MSSIFITVFESLLTGPYIDSFSMDTKAMLRYSEYVRTPYYTPLQKTSGAAPNTLRIEQSPPRSLNLQGPGLAGEKETGTAFASLMHLEYVGLRRPLAWLFPPALGPWLDQT